MSNLIKNFVSKATDVVEPKARNTQTFKNDTSYELEITGVAVQSRDSGYNNLELTVSKVDGDSLRKAGKLWVSMPVYSDDIAEGMDPVKFKQMKQIAQEQFLQLLAAALPNDIGADAGSLKERTAAAVGIAEAFVAADDSSDFPVDLVGQRLFYVSVAGKKTYKDKDGNDAIRTYHNFSAEALDRFPLFNDEA